MTTYHVVWHNPSDCDTLGVYDTYEEAEAAGESWLMMMISIDPDPEEAEEAYGYEIKEVNDEDEDDPDNDFTRGEHDL